MTTKILSLAILLGLTGCAHRGTLCEDLTPENCSEYVRHAAPMKAVFVPPGFGGTVFEEVAIDSSVIPEVTPDTR